jgi:very-short-patch-repair endonuclease
MINQEELLVGIINNNSDFEILRDKHWYRIPITSANKFLLDRWPPKWIAFYFSGKIKNNPFMIKHYAKITEIKIVARKTLFPNEIKNPKTNKRYYRISFDELITLQKPILSRRWRRIVFIQSTIEKLKNAAEINDLFDGSSLEDKLWSELKRNEIEAERQELIQVDKKYYFLDFAIYCTKGKLDIETDGDIWHHNPIRSTQDNIRNNDLSSVGWNIVRFDSNQVNEQITTYCIPQIKTNINNLGGIKIDETFSKRFIQN